MAGYQFLVGFAAIVAAMIVSFVVGYFLARSFRMPDHGWKIGLVLTALSVGALVNWMWWPPRKGIDLSGGVTLVYEIDTEQQEVAQALDNTTMGKLAGAISRRVDPRGLEEITIRPYGENQVQIIVPNADEADVRRIENKVSRQGTLEFRILANRLDHEDLIERAEKMPLTMRRLRQTISGQEQEVERARWVPIGENAKEFATNPNFATRVGARGEPEILVIIDTQNVTGDLLQRARPTIDQRGRDAVGFDFNAIGSERFRRLTSENQPTETGGTTFYRHLAIIIDESLYTAPQLRDIITGSGIIEGEFNKEQVEEDVAVLNAGSLPAVLKKEPSSRTFIGPTLGQDTIRRGGYAMGLSLIGTFVFMTIYYRFAGLVASMAMMMNLMLLMAMMILFKAAFTLPGLAGIALTVGMAVDANVLIYERMREELARGASLRMAIRNGFSRAMTTIIDSNLTTLITAGVLYAIGTDQIKGFALTLIFGIALSMFTAIFCARVVFDIAEKMRWITTLRMMQLLDKTNIDFIGWRRVAIGGSWVLIAIGLIGVFTRGYQGNLLDIDFTGGSEVTLVLKQPENIAAVRQKAEDVLPDVAVSSVRPSQNELAGQRYVISTSNQDIAHVEAKLVEAFGQKLASGSLEYKQVPIPAAEAQKPAAASPATSPPATPPSTTTPPPASTPESPARAPSSDKQGVLINPSAEGLLALAEFQPPATDAPATTPPTAASDAAAQPAAETPTTPSPGTPGEGRGEGSPAATAPAQSPAVTDAQSAAPAAPPPGTERTRFELSFSPQRMSYDALKEEIEKHLQQAGHQAVFYTISHPQHVEGANEAFETWTLEIALPAAEATKVVELFKQARQSTPLFPATSKIGGRVAGDTQLQALYALLASIIGIMLYIWLRFESLVFSVAAVVALLHDVLITLGLIALSFWLAKVFGFLMIEPFKINLTIVAAILTIIGYSLNDTIVVFDRIREVRGKSPDFSEAMLNTSINFTLGRTLLTGLTTMMVVLILYIVGGSGIHGFAYTLLIGMLVGTYSSIFIAAPMLLWLGKKPQPGARRAEPAARRAAV